ncbi:MAG: CoA ester lyase [Magnetococcales bacterium]|nr:CoA ester lyase [Magnetococcales bacterium]NGZ07510.1 CoA ester lyase [Magnetococcales bacterium]
MKASLSTSLLRSVLYVPGSNPKTLAKAPTLSADGLILDLEDSVAPEAKNQARLNVLSTLHATRDTPNLVRVVRINAIHTDLWHDDLTITLPGRPDAVAISKVESPDELEGPAALLRHLEETQGHACRLWAMIETPLGVLNALAIARHPLVTCLVMGTSDLARALIIPGDPQRIGLRHALQQTILAARAAHVQIIDGVYVNIRDPEGFAAECLDGARLGFDGKSLIHPSQIAPANQTFLPGADEALADQTIVAAWNEARARGEEICVVHGKLVERLHADQAAQRLARWEMAQKNSKSNPEI